MIKIYVLLVYFSGQFLNPVMFRDQNSCKEVAYVLVDDVLDPDLDNFILCQEREYKLEEEKKEP